jgi:hypothetical protein
MRGIEAGGVLPHFRAQIAVVSYCSEYIDNGLWAPGEVLHVRHKTL